MRTVINDCVSIIMVYNDQEKMNEAKQWVEKQSISNDIELIVLDNRDRRFSSAAKALNYGAEHARGKVLVFMHQDVYLWDLEAIEKYREYLHNNPEHIIGVAGVPAGMRAVTDIFLSEDIVQPGHRTNGKIIPVDSVDECLFAMDRSVWARYRFDEICCDDWHCYGADICFAHTVNGGMNMIVPLKICHASLGDTQNRGFRQTVGKLIRKYEGTKIKYIHSCCVNARCSKAGYGWYRTREFVKDVLKFLHIR